MSYQREKDFIERRLAERDMAREQKRQEFQTAILLDYIVQIEPNWFPSEFASVLRQMIDESFVHVRWAEVDKPEIFKNDAGIVKVALPEWLFGLLAADSDLYFTLRATPIERVNNWLKNRADELFYGNPEGDDVTYSRLASPVQKEGLEKELMDVVVELARLTGFTQK